MRLGEATLDALNGQLGALAQELTGLSDEDASFFAFDAWAADDAHLPKVVRISHILLLALSHLEDQASFPDAPESLGQVYELARARGLHVSVSAPALDFRVLQYLVTEVQAALLLRRLRRKAQPQEVRALKVAAADNRQLAFELKKVTKALDVDATVARDLLDILDLVLARVDAKLGDESLSLSSAQRLLAHVPDLDDPQRALLRDIEANLYQDFQLRRRMLVERLQVTLESLATSPALPELPALAAPALALRRYSSEHALQAPASLLQEQSRPVTQRGGKRSVVKKAVLGQVPDRGGRANEIRASHKRPMGGGGGGGGRGRGGGGGGGGGRGGSGRRGGNSKEVPAGRVVEAAPAGAGDAPAAAVSTASAGVKEGKGKPFKRQRR